MSYSDMKKSAGNFQYDNQNFLQLASIQIVALGLPVIIVGKNLAASFGAGTAICSIAVGNLILWLIAITIISMVDRSQSTAIDNIKTYLGKYGSLAIAIIFMVAFLGWYALQIDLPLKKLNGLVLCECKLQQGMLIRTGAVLGLISAMLAIGGIRLLRQLTFFGLPLLLIYDFYAIASSNQVVTLKGTWGISFQAVLTSILILLPGVINYPTFFRHAHSKSHAYLSLTLITVFITFLEISTIWMELTEKNQLIHDLFFTTFIVFTLITSNLLNIYLASACWESIIPKFGSVKGFAIIGLLGTLFYTFIQISSPMQFLQNLTNAYIAVLGIVLLIAYLLRILLKHRPRPFEKMINLATWLVGCIAATIYESQHFLAGVPSLLAGVSVSLLFLLCVLFIEEALWAIRKKMFKLNH
jgi:purine-cytosine permease-like protein